MKSPTGLIAEDEPQICAALVRALKEAWPELVLVAIAKNGREAVDRFEELVPDVCFLDVHMPEMSGVEAAGFIGARAQVVFVTAFDQYAVQAFEHGAVDYLVKPVQPERLAAAVRRMKDRLAAQDVPQIHDPLDPESWQPQRRTALVNKLRWLRVSMGQSLKLVRIDEIDYAKSNGKHTIVAWHDDRHQPCQGLIRMRLGDLIEQLDSSEFLQVHRSVLVRLRAVDQVSRTPSGRYRVHLRRRTEVLPVSRALRHLFRQM